MPSDGGKSTLEGAVLNRNQGSRSGRGSGRTSVGGLRRSPFQKTWFHCLADSKVLLPEAPTKFIVASPAAKPSHPGP